MRGPSNPRNDKINDEKDSLFSFPPSNLRRLGGFSFVCVFFFAILVYVGVVFYYMYVSLLSIFVCIE
jgi:hypothetical protein